MKTALVHEWFITPGGSEKVVEAIFELFPVDLFALLHDKQKMAGTFFADKKIKTSFLQSLPLATKKHQLFLPLFPLAIEQFALSNYDLIISSSHSVAKGVLTHSEQVHVCYCHTPARYFWDLYHDYLQQQQLDTYRGKGLLARLIFHYLRSWDYLSATRVDHFIANSNYVANRIKKTYGREAKVIYPPVKIDNFPLSKKKENYYLTVSRLVAFRKSDLIVQAFAQ